MKHVQLLILVSSKKKFVFLERQEKDKIKNSVDILSQIKYKLSATATKQCCGSGMFIPDPRSDFFLPRIPDPNCLQRIKEFKYFNHKKNKKKQKMVSKLWKI
jgi:hypothetical protein